MNLSRDIRIVPENHELARLWPETVWRISMRVIANRTRKWSRLLMFPDNRIRDARYCGSG